MGGHRLHAELADALLLVVDGLPARTKLIVNTREGRARARAREGGRDGGRREGEMIDRCLRLIEKLSACK